MSGSVVPERVHRWAGDTGRAGDVHAGAVGQTDLRPPVVLGQVSEKFREAVKAQAERERIPVHQFQHKERKDDIANEFQPAARRAGPNRLHRGGAGEGQSVQWHEGQRSVLLNRDKTIYVNHYYFYIDDDDFGPLFIKVCSYAPWGIKPGINGHEWAKRQLEKRKIGYEALDNGFLSCAEPEKLQQICDSLGPEQIERLFRKWLKRIPLRRCGRKTGG